MVDEKRIKGQRRQRETIYRKENERYERKRYDIISHRGRIFNNNRRKQTFTDFGGSKKEVKWGT